MAKTTERTTASTDEMQRVAEQVSERLQRRGVSVYAKDSPEISPRSSKPLSNLKPRLKRRAET